MNPLKLTCLGMALLCVLFAFSACDEESDARTGSGESVMNAAQDEKPGQEPAKKVEKAEAKKETAEKVEPEAKGKPSAHPVVLMKTSMGDIKIELDREKAPVTVENFLKYVKDGYYKDTLFHRVIPNFMIQGGGFTESLYKNPVSARPKKTNPPIKNEAKNGLKNKRGTIAMARTNVVDSATSQFFINVVDNGSLDHRGVRSFGYAVFGKVIEGMEIADKIRHVKTKSLPNRMKDVPVDPVKILSVKIIKN